MTHAPQVQVPEALRISAALQEPIDGFPEPTTLEVQAAEELCRLHAENEALHAQVAALTQPAQVSAVESNTAGADPEHVAATWLTDPTPTPERQFCEWLNSKRGCNVSEVFHEIMQRFASHGQAPAVPVGPCVICGSDEPFTGTCGSADPRALCKQPTPTVQAAQAAPAAGAVAGPNWRELLQELEWSAGGYNRSGDGESMCPCCEQWKSAGHASDCRLATMLAAAPTPAAQASGALTGGDERRHIICVCPDCVAPKADSGVQEDAARWLAERDNVMHSFWVLLSEAESQADNDNNPVLKHQVEGFYRQWNALSGGCHVPRWVERAARATGAKP